MSPNSQSHSTDSEVGTSQYTIKDEETFSESSSSNYYSEESSSDEDETSMRYFVFSITSFRFLCICF